MMLSEDAYLMKDGVCRQEEPNYMTRTTGQQAI